jgi:ribulose-phosphate 3-epimerase
MIIPALLEKNPLDFAHKLAKIKTIGKLPRVQVDFCDELFVPSHTVQVEDLGHVPRLDQAEWEAHIMAIHPQNFSAYKEAGFSTVIVHYESFPEEKYLEEALEIIAKLGMKPAIAISPETTVSVLRYFTDTIKQFTILSVEPGQQGNPFLPLTYDRIKTLREMAPNATIEVDGGVNANNAAALIEAGADYLVVGSALFETENIKQNYLKIESAGTTI